MNRFRNDVVFRYSNLIDFIEEANTEKSTISAMNVFATASELRISRIL